MRMIIRWKKAASLALCCWTFGIFAATLVENGRSEYEIVIRPDAPRVTRYAAEELQSYVKKVTGADLPVKTTRSTGRKALYLGGHAELPSEAKYDPKNYNGAENFLIDELSAGDLVIMGADCDMEPLKLTYGDFGLLFGVYEFLERFLGVRWYAPGELGECFEPMKKAEITGLPVEDRPNAWARYYWPNIWNEMTDVESAKFSRRLRGWGVRPGGTNHSMMDLYFPYKETKPEIFALQPDGKNRRFGSFQKGTAPEQRKWADYPQYCFSNPDTLKAYCDFIDAVYRKDPAGKLWVNMPPTADAIHVVPDDNFTTQPCSCEKCRAAIDHKTRGRGTMTPLVWDFVRKVAEYAKKHYPGKKVMGLAYEGYYEPPAFELPDNVVVQICVNPYLIYMGAPAYRKAYEETLRKWGAKVKEISAWHYLLPYDYIPYAMPHIMYQHFRDFPDVKAVFLELNDSNMRPTAKRRPEHKTTTACDLAQVHLNLYFAMRGMWQNKIDVNAELDRYYRLFYGPAAQEMKKFHELSIPRWENVEGIEFNPTASYARFSGKELYEKIYPEKIVREMKVAFERARELAPESGIYRKRLDWIADSYFNAFVGSAEAFAREANASRDQVLFDAGKPPVHDGTLGDPFWKNTDAFDLVRIDAPLPPRYGATCRIAVADGKLWVGVQADDPDIATAKTERNVHDGDIFMDDSIELFIVPDPAKPEEFKNITANLNGVIADYAHTAANRFDRSFESGAVAKAVRSGKGYTMVFAVPLEKLGLAGNSFKLNICRNKVSGVGENNERSAWSCPYGSFWNVTQIPSIHLLTPEQSKACDRFNDPKRSYRSVMTHVSRDSKMHGTTEKGCNLRRDGSRMVVEYTFDESNDVFDYGSFGCPALAGADLSNAPFIEVRFRNPSADLHHTVTYAYQAEDGKVYGDYMRFCVNESHPDFRIRSVNLMTDGKAASIRMKQGKAHPKPVKLLSFSIYSSSPKRDGKPMALTLDYVRVTDKPLDR